MKNKLTNLQDHLFELMEKLNDDDLTGDALDQEIRRSEAFSNLADKAIKNAVVMVKCADTFGVEVDDLPLLPSPEMGVISKKTEKCAKKRTLLKDKDYDDE